MNHAYAKTRICSCFSGIYSNDHDILITLTKLRDRSMSIDSDLATL